MTSNDHGWEFAGYTTGAGNIPAGAVVHFGMIVDERKRCACARVSCRREATQEDLLCDECRETCR